MGDGGLEAMRKEESRVERLLGDGKMSLVKQDELRYDMNKLIQRYWLTVTPVIVTQYKGFWLQRHLFHLQIGLSYSKQCLDSMTQYVTIWLQ